MKKNLIIILLTGSLVIPFSANASILDDLYGVVRDLQKQVVSLMATKIDLVKPVAIKATTTPEVWNTFASSTLGYEVEYPRDFGTTTIFAVASEYNNADALVRISREEFLRKILKPGTLSIGLAVQDSAIFFRPAELDDMYINQDKYLNKISTSTKMIGSTTVEYILHSEKTDSNKFGGGSTEKIIFTNGSTTIMAEANFSADIPSGPTKVVFDKMLTTFKFVRASSTPRTSTTTLGVLDTTASTTESVSTSTVSQVAGTLLVR